MPIDPNIPLSVFRNSPNIGEIMGRAQNYKLLLGQGKLQRMQLSEQERQMAEAAAIRSAAAGAVNPASTQQVNIPGVNLPGYGDVGGHSDTLTSPTSFDRDRFSANIAANPQTAYLTPQYQSQFAQQDAQAATAKHQQILGQYELALKSGQIDAQTHAAFADANEQVGKAAGAILQAPPEQRPQVYQRALQLLAQSPNPMVRKMLEQAPPQYQPGMDGQLQEWFNHSMSISDIAKRVNPEPLKQTPGVEVPFSPDVAAQKIAIARASKPAPDPTKADNSRMDKSYQYTNSQLVKLGDPIEQLSTRVGRLQETLAQRTPQADSLVAPELLSVMAGGMGSGLRMNEAEIARIVGGRSAWESLSAAMNKISTDPKGANSITPAQRQQMQALVDAVSQKIVKKRQIIEDANQQLINAGDVYQHRNIVAATRKSLADVDAGASTGYVRIQASDGSVHDIPQQNLGAAKQRDPGLKVVQQ